jgi:hypothetical protein
VIFQRFFRDKSKLAAIQPYKSSRVFSTKAILREILLTEIKEKIYIAGKEKRITILEALLCSLIAKAMKGDMQACREVLNRFQEDEEITTTQYASHEEEIEALNTKLYNLEKKSTGLFLDEKLEEYKMRFSETEKAILVDQIIDGRNHASDRAAEEIINNAILQKSEKLKD